MERHTALKEAGEGKEKNAQKPKKNDKIHKKIKNRKDGNKMTGMDYVRMGIEAHKNTQRKRELQRQGLSPRTSMPQKAQAKPTVKMETFSGSFEDTKRQVNAFYRKMSANPNFKYLNTSTVPTMNGVIVHITYQS